MQLRRGKKYKKTGMFNLSIKKEKKALKKIRNYMQYYYSFIM